MRSYISYTKEKAVLKTLSYSKGLYYAIVSIAYRYSFQLFDGENNSTFSGLFDEKIQTMSLGDLDMSIKTLTFMETMRNFLLSERYSSSTKKVIHLFLYIIPSQI